MNRDLLLSCLFEWVFISFSCTVALSRTLDTMMNRSGKSGHTCLVPNLREKAFSLSPFSMMLLLAFSYSMLRGFPSIHSLLTVFYLEKVLNFVTCTFSAAIEMSIFPFHSVNIVYYINFLNTFF